MLGMGSVEMALAYVLCLAASVFCVVYGVLKWNDKGRVIEQKVEVKRGGK